MSLRCWLLLTWAVLLTGCGGSRPALLGRETNPSSATSLDEVLAQLQAETPPAGLDTVLYAQLQDELARTLLALAGTAADPFARQGAQSGTAGEAVQLEWDEAAATLSWYFTNPGDYDQNGEVGISDLTPLGQHFGATAALGTAAAAFGLLDSPDEQPFGHRRVESVIDGDHNGAINISDVTPIGQYFGKRLTGFAVYAGQLSGDYPGAGSAPSTLPPIGEIALASALGDKATERLQFSFLVPAEQHGLSYWVRPVFTDGEGSSSNVAGAPLQYPPGSLALLSASPASCEPGEVITLEFNQPVAAQLADLTLQLEDEPALSLDSLAVANASTVYVIAPLLMPGSYSFTVASAGGSVGSFVLELQASAPELTPAGLEQEHQLAVEGVKLIADPEFSASFFNDLELAEQVDHAGLRAELDKYDQLFLVLHTWMQEELAALSAAEQQQVLGYLENVGYADILDSLSIATMQTSKAASSTAWDGTNFERLYYDAISARIRNNGIYFDLATIVLGTVANWAGFAVAASSLVLSLHRDIIDRVYPTDIVALEAVMPRHRLAANFTHTLAVYGLFYSEKKPGAGQTLLDIISALVNALPLPNLAKQEVLHEIGEYVLTTSADVGLQLALADEIPTIDDGDNPYEGHVAGGWAQLDPYLYEIDNPKVVYAKLGFQWESGQALELSEAHYRNKSYPPQFPQSSRQDPGDFITSIGGSIKYQLGERAAATVSFPGSGRKTLIFRAFSFRTDGAALLSRSYLELVSSTEDFWVGRDSDWQVHEVLSEADNPLGQAVLNYNAHMLLADEHPVVLAGLGSLVGNSQVYCITADTPFGTTWLEPVSISAGSIPSYQLEFSAFGLFLNRPAVVIGTAFQLAADETGTVWPQQWNTLPPSSEHRNFQIFAHKYPEDAAAQPALLGSTFSARVYRRDESTQAWDLIGYYDPSQIDLVNFQVALIDGRPAVAYNEYIYEGVHPHRVLVAVKVHYAIAQDPLGQAWNAPVQVLSSTMDGEGNFYYYHVAAMTEAAGVPVILLGGKGPRPQSAVGFDGLHTTSAGNSAGMSWTLPADVYAPDNWAQYARDAILIHHNCFRTVAGVPAVAYTVLSFRGSVVQYSTALDSGGQQWAAAAPVAYVSGVPSGGSTLDPDSPARALIDNAGHPGILVYQPYDPEPDPLTVYRIDPLVASTRLVYAAP